MKFLMKNHVYVHWEKTYMNLLMEKYVEVDYL